MNEKLQLVGLLFLYDNFIFGHTIIKLMNKKDKGLSVSLISEINFLKNRMLYKKINKENNE